MLQAFFLIRDFCLLSKIIKIVGFDDRNSVRLTYNFRALQGPSTGKKSPILISLALTAMNIDKSTDNNTGTL